MIFVTLGTQKQPFKRIIDLVVSSNELSKDSVVIQSGNTDYSINPEKTKIQLLNFVEMDSFVKYIDEAEFVICHGGVGSIFNALHKGKKVLAIPRLKKYSEHVDNHQIEICKKLSESGYIETILDDETNYEKFDEIIRKIRKSEYKKYKIDTQYLDILEKEI